MSPHLLAAISYHGFGHIAQSAPVINELARRVPGLRVTVQCAAPVEILQSHFACDFTHVNEDVDVGMANGDALKVLVDESARRYDKFHENWDHKIRRAARQLRRLDVDVVLADVPYLSLAAAQQAGIPAVAMCSLNWADIYAHYCGDRPEATSILAQVRASYAAAHTFLQPEPSMPMRDLRNTRRIGPIARLGGDCRDELRRTLGVAAHERMVLVSLGGIATKLPIAQWPRIDGIRWLTQRRWQIEHPDALAWDRSEITFIDALRSSDAFICKPGYGSFVEAACNDVPTLYVPRGDWPEEPCLVDWLEAHASCAAITPREFASGAFHDTLMRLLAKPRPPSIKPTGIPEAVEILLGFL